MRVRLRECVRKSYGDLGKSDEYIPYLRTGGACPCTEIRLRILIAADCRSLEVTAIGARAAYSNISSHISQTVSSLVGGGGISIKFYPQYKLEHSPQLKKSIQGIEINKYLHPNAKLFGEYLHVSMPEQVMLYASFPST